MGVADDILSDGGNTTTTTTTTKALPQFDFAAQPIEEMQSMDDDQLLVPQQSDERTFDQKLDASEQLKINALRVSRQNPFGKLKRNNTRKALAEMEDLANAKENLPKLEAWLEKKQNSMPYQWQKRWVVVKGSYLLWSDKQRSIKDAKSVSDRKKFNNSINILAITLIDPVTKGKSQRKFVITVGNKEDNGKYKEYMWKCATMDDRDFWVKSMNRH